LAVIDDAIRSAGRPIRDPNDSEDSRQQIRQLIKQALDIPTAENLADYLGFATRFRRLAVWNTRMAYIQRPGARVIGSEYEWARVGRYVLPDAIPIIILWPFSPIRFVYELADTGPPIDREEVKDPFGVRGEFREGVLSTLIANLKKQKAFKIDIELRRQGFSYAGSAASQIPLPLLASTALPLSDDKPIEEFAHGNANISELPETKHSFRVTINDRLEPKERLVTLAHELAHIFCGHLGGCSRPGRDDDQGGWPDRRHLGIHEREIEAESVAYLISSRARVTTRSPEYLKTHARKADMSRVNIDLTVRAAARIERLGKIHYGTMTFGQ
jgi:IrrE N-terminal-like domain